jgi:hypothetical protein
MTTLSVSELVNKSEPAFDEWLDEQEFDYRRVESEAIDYANEVLDYEAIVSSSEQITAIKNWDELFNACGIEEDSQRGEAVKRHIRAYVESRSG